MELINDSSIDISFDSFDNHSIIHFLMCKF